MLAIDVATFFAVTVPTTLLMTWFPHALWVVAPVSGVALARGYRAPKTSSPLDGFKVAKAVSSFAALAVFHASQLGATIPNNVMTGIVAVNILEAVAMDVLIGGRYGWPNAVVGTGLTLLLPEQKQWMDPGAAFPLPLWWILLYTTWNAAFAYGVGLSWGCGLILLVPLCAPPHLWPVARAYSLVLQQVLRGSQALWIWQPGKSIITKEEGAPSVDDGKRLAAGVVNLCLLCISMHYHSYAPLHPRPPRRLLRRQLRGRGGDGGV